jgi:ubiquinone biosynthesis protein UbiJ
LARLEGRTLKLTLEGVGIELYFAFGGGRVAVSAESDDTPDTHVSGTPLALFRMAGPEEAADWGLPESDVTIEGNASLARDLERLFGQLEPDIEGRLAKLFGDVVGYQVAQGLRQGVDALRGMVRQSGEMLGRYVREEGRLLVRRAELDTFRASVDELARDLDTLEARLSEQTGDADGPDETS